MGHGRAHEDGGQRRPAGRGRRRSGRRPGGCGGPRARRTGFPRIEVPVTPGNLSAGGTLLPMPKSSTGAGSTDGKPRDRVAISNRRARHEYFILDSYECGIVLVGSEVKSIRDGRANLGDAYARIENGEVWLYGMHVSPYPFSRIGHDPDPAAQAAPPPERDRPARRQAHRGRPHAGAPQGLLPARDGQDRAGRRPGQAPVGQAPGAWPKRDAKRETDRAIRSRNRGEE